MRRVRGVSAVEFIVFTAMSLMLIGVGYDMLRRGSIVGHTTHTGLQLQQGVRNLMENFVIDVQSSVYIGEPHALSGAPGDPSHRVVLWLFNDTRDDSTGVQKLGERLTINDGPNSGGLTGGRNPWPFHHTDGPTRWHLPVLEVIYEWDEAGRKVIRKTAEGDLWQETTEDAGAFVDKFTFQPTGVGETERVMAENVEMFDVWPFGYDEHTIDPLTELGELRPTYQLPDLVAAQGATAEPIRAGFGGGSATVGGNAGTTDRIPRTAMLWVKLKARFDYESTKYRDPEVFMATKVWSHAKLHEHIYFPYFSSVDDDLRF